jgi:hypothetical protein
MLEYDVSTQSEKRGRFLIQEIEHYYNDNLKNNHLSANFNNCVVNCSKRPKHSSIVMDSKIFHTTHMDSNFSNIMFQTFVYEENTKDWKEFDLIWREFSKDHCDVVEDDMEKIFHYIDKRIDESDFFTLNNNSMLKFKSDDNDLIIHENGIKNTITNTDTIIRDSIYNDKLLDFNVKVKQDYSDKENNKSIQIKFCPISPINSNSKMINFNDYNSGARDNKLLFYHLTKSESKKKLKKKSKLKIVKINEFSLINNTVNKINNVNKIKREVDLKVLNSCGNEKICKICKNVITD